MQLTLYVTGQQDISECLDNVLFQLEAATLETDVSGNVMDTKDANIVKR